MAAEWGGISLAKLLDHGLLDRRKEIGSISAEATASAVLRKTLEVDMWICHYSMDTKIQANGGIYTYIRSLFYIYTQYLPTCECEGSFASQMPLSG